MILSIDPGNIESAYVIMSNDLIPCDFGKVVNDEILEIINKYNFEKIQCEMAIEMVASYGMPVGEEVFETVFWIGRFWEAFEGKKAKVYRKDVKINLCGTMKAKDANIRQALIDRFGVVGVKSKPGWFYGFKSDIWSAYAVGVTYSDLCLNK